MFDSQTALIVIGFLTFLLAGFVKGVIGLGLPTVAIGLLGLVMTPVQAASLLVVPSLVTNVWQLAAGPALGLLLRRFWSMLLGICAGTWFGAGLWGGESSGRATIVLGMALMAYAALGLAVKRFSLPPRFEGFLSPIVGVMTGMLTAVTGVFVIPAVPFLQALDLTKEELVQALGLSFTVSTVALAGALVYLGTFHLSVAGASALALLPAMAGMFFGQRLRSQVRPDTFRRCFLIGMLLLGAHLAIRNAI